MSDFSLDPRHHCQRRTIDKLLAIFSIFVPGYSPVVFSDCIPWNTESPDAIPLSDDGPLYEPERSCERRLLDAFAVICTHSYPYGDSLAVCLRNNPVYARSVFLYVALPGAATVEFVEWTKLLAQIVQKQYEKLRASGPPETRPLIIKRGRHVLSLVGQQSDHSALPPGQRRVLKLLTNDLQALVNVVERAHAGDGGKDQFDDIFRLGLTLAMHAHDKDFEDFVRSDELDIDAERSVVNGLKSLTALPLAVKDLYSVLCDLVDFECRITSWDVSVIGGSSAISDSPPSPTPEEVQGWFVELLQDRENSHAWCDVLAYASKVAYLNRSHVVANDAIHGEAVLMHYIVEHNITVHPYIATSNDTMCFACCKLLEAVNARCSRHLWTTSCCDLARFPRLLSALPEDIEKFVVEDLMGHIRPFADMNQRSFARYNKVVSKSVVDQKPNEWKWCVTGIAARL